jgi:hypothetical protein
MNWEGVGSWLKDHGVDGLGLVGSLLTGNVRGAVSAGQALVSKAAGTSNPAEALTRLQADPAVQVRLKELYYANQVMVKNHLKAMADIETEQLRERMNTVREGDKATDEFVRRTRPVMARQSWQATVAYGLGCWLFQAFTGSDIFNMYLAGTLSAPAWAYLGLRTGDKFAQALKRT